MKLQYILKFSLVCLIFCVGLAKAEQTIDPAHLKNARFMSKMYLGAQQQKNIKLQEEQKVDRQRLESALKILEKIKPSSSLVPIKPVMQQYKLSASAQGKAVSTKTIKSRNSKQAVKNSAVVRKQKYQQAVLELAGIRNAFDAETKPAWKFWKAKDKKEKRKELLSSKLAEVEDMLVAKDRLSMREYKELKQKLTVEKYKGKGEQTLPAVRNIVSKIERVPLPERRGNLQGSNNAK